MKEIVRSVKPYWFFLICEGIKTAELGKDKPKADNWNKAVNLYCSKDKKSFERIPKEFKEKYRKYLGKIGARFICNKIEDFSKHIINTTNRYELQTMHDIYTKTCVTYNEICDYLNKREEYKPFYIWHISNLEIYHEPRELSEFKTFCKDFYNGNHCDECKYFIDGRGYEYDESDCGCNGLKPIERPPQSWCYVEV